MARLLGIAFALVPAAFAQTNNVSVFATGLNNPRGLKFGPDGNLYVAEGGTAGTDKTVGVCPQVPGVGPYTGGFTARISKIAPDGTRTTVADHLPSSKTNAATGAFVSGVADVAFIHGDLYAITAGAGCSHGLVGTNNAVLRVNSNGTTSRVANLSAYQKHHPVANPEPDDFEPDGTWYSMISLDDFLIAVEPNHGELDAISDDGRIFRISDISRSQGHIVPTALAFHNGNFFVGNLERFPIEGDTSKILKITPFGEVTTVHIDFSTILGLAFDKNGNFTSSRTPPGTLSRHPEPARFFASMDGTSTPPFASGLFLSTAMTFGADGNLYVSNVGFGGGPGDGQVVKVVVPY